MSGQSPSQMTPLQRALSPSMLLRSAIIALVVGSVLNLINQGDTMFAGGDISLFKLVLTYCVPFLVSTYGAWSMAKSVHDRD